MSDLTTTDDPNRLRQKTFLSTYRKKDNEYMPVIQVIRRYVDTKLEHYLYIQVSLPKLFYGHGLRSVTESRFYEALEILSSKLLSMGLGVSVQALKKSVLLKIHFCIDIDLTQHNLTVREAIADLQKAYISKSLEINHRDFRNTGEALYFFSKVKEVVFYNKSLEMLKSDAKSFDKDGGSNKCIEYVVASQLQKQKKEILRFEFRLTHSQTTKSYLSPILKKENNDDILLLDILDKNVSEKALLKMWTTIIKQPQNQLAFKIRIDDDKIFDRVAEQYKGKKVTGHTLNKIMIESHIYRFLNDIGFNTLKEKLRPFFSIRTIKRLREKIELVCKHLNDLSQRDSISIIDNAIRECKSYQFINPND